MATRHLTNLTAAFTIGHAQDPRLRLLATTVDVPVLPALPTRSLSVNQATLPCSRLA
ncbi:hypothetical protein HPP92_017583 [Vanilla planifolia]|uniref:Uncharacterized protein n=1 Tax=Vanilla planifolia TaxID=51239 RepID=A0A835QCM4_VANPL|nr:hypothetical protein HPP92_017583 [Vanilla planifolia]